MSWCLCLYDWEGGILQGQRNGLRAGYASLKCSHHHEGVVRMALESGQEKNTTVPDSDCRPSFSSRWHCFFTWLRQRDFLCPWTSLGQLETQKSSHGPINSSIQTMDPAVAEHVTSISSQIFLGKNCFRWLLIYSTTPQKNLSKACLESGLESGHESGQGNVCVSPELLTD